MNKVILMGRLTRDPDVRYSNGENVTAVARFTLAVDRRFARRDGDQQTADFIGCVAFGRNAEFIEKYFRQGMRVTICGRIQTGSYTNRDGNKVYTTDVVVESRSLQRAEPLLKQIAVWVVAISPLLRQHRIPWEQPEMVL